jgi:hypothetical protein
MVISLFAAFAAGLYCSLRHNREWIGLGHLGAVTGATRTDMKLKPSISVLAEPPSVSLSPTMVYQYVLNQEDHRSEGADGSKLSQHCGEQENFSKYARTCQYGAVPRPPGFELVSIDGHSGSILPPSMMPAGGSSTKPISIPKSNAAGHQNDERVHLAAGIHEWA